MTTSHDHPLCSSGPRTARMTLLCVATVAASIAPLGTANAQSSMPGLVITTSQPPQVVSPQASPPFGAPPVAAAPPSNAPPPSVQPPSAAPPPAAKAKPKTAPKKEASATPAHHVSDASSSQGIVALVNDDPITAYEVQERAAFLALTVDFQDRARANMKAFAQDPKINDRLKAILEETIKANPGKSREQVIAAFEERKKAFVISLQQQAVASARSSYLPGLKKKALEELIEERLKLQEAKRLNAVTPDDDVDKAFKGMAERNKMTPDQFAQHIKSQGADARTMKARFKASFSWREVIRRRFGHQISVSSKEVDRVAAASADAGHDLLELQLQKITVVSPAKVDQNALAQRYAEAEAIRQRFNGCKATASLVKDKAHIKFEDLGFRKASSLSEPTRTLLLSAGDNEMVPATPTAAGMELYAVCGRRTPKIDEQKRQAAENELQQKEFDRLAQRHLADLRKDALIEMR